MKYNIHARHVPGKDMLVPDVLSRSPLNTERISTTAGDVEMYVQMMETSLPTSDVKKSAFGQAVPEDSSFAVNSSLHTDRMAKIPKGHSRKPERIVCTQSIIICLTWSPAVSI